MPKDPWKKAHNKDVTKRAKSEIASGYSTPSDWYDNDAHPTLPVSKDVKRSPGRRPRHSLDENDERFVVGQSSVPPVDGRDDTTEKQEQEVTKGSDKVVCEKCGTECDVKFFKYIDPEAHGWVGHNLCFDCRKL